MKVLSPALFVVAVLSVSPALAQNEASIAFRDLDLSTAAGAAAFDARIDQAAAGLCRNFTIPGSRIVRSQACRSAVRAEAMRQLPRSRQVEYARAPRGARQVAQVVGLFVNS
ncbi:UrcA family protein [Brevundimonas sp. SL130]|uniref:UrcA family protein n=1 Tax=Brevundimonas sp. SL130 TaxID=2995143 RepID=UPI00226D1135|nr:UrcA family protein [Brevundimonas sp. SL130]WAC60384.1 UrcA family protein [Brevundimonas sp. SL130]